MKKNKSKTSKKYVDIENGLEFNENIPQSSKFALITSTIITISVIFYALRYSNYGFDFTDESFYLIWMSNPFQYAASTSQFGFIYHPIYLLFDGNIPALRCFNIISTYILAWVCCDTLLKLSIYHVAFQQKTRLVISASIATTIITAFIFAGFWLVTPGYNSLNLQAILLCSTGLLLAEKTTTKSSIIGWILIGISGWLAFMAKPPTAAALGIISVIYLLLSGKIRIRLLFTAICLAALLTATSAIIIDGSIHQFSQRLMEGIKIISLLSTDHSLEKIIRLDDLEIDKRLENFVITFTILIFICAHPIFTNRKYFPTFIKIIFATSIIICAGLIFEITSQPYNFQRLEGFFIWPLPFAIIFISISEFRFRFFSLKLIKKLIIPLMLLTLPYAYAIGTNNNYWVLIASSGFFVILASLAFLISMAPHLARATSLLPLCLIAQLATVAMVQSALKTPYRQPQPLSENNVSLKILNSEHPLLLTRDFSQYISDAIGAADRSGLPKQAPMIDMTGLSPGIVYAVGANSIGQPWLFGGYPGSNAFAIEAFKGVSCRELAAAWLLVEPHGPRTLSSNILASFGANRDTDFDIVGTFKTAAGASGIQDIRSQQFLKPRRNLDVATAACAASRSGK